MGKDKVVFVVGQVWTDKDVPKAVGLTMAVKSIAGKGILFETKEVGKKPQSLQIALARAEGFVAAGKLKLLVAAEEVS